MSTPMPDTTLSGVVQGSLIVATWSPKGYSREITRAAIAGPSGSQFDIYVGTINDSCRRGTTNRGDVNQGDFSNPIPVPAGLIVFFVWSNWTVATPATVTIGYNRV